MKKILIGGQAVIEGVLMRAPNHYSIAVRKPNNKISVKTEKYIPYTKRNKFLGLPFIRGVIILIETVILGSKALTYSANESTDEKEEQLTKWEIGFTLLISILAALFIFKLLPLFAANVLTKKLGLSNAWFNIADGLIKIGIFIAYLWAISLMKDVKRMFEYHGAEHMSVHCYEAEKKLTVANVRAYKTMHPRCGTEFLLLVLVISILFYMLIPFGSNFWAKYLLRLLLLPVIAGFSYEVLKITGLHHDKWISRVISAPGMLLQRITTSKPDDKQIEVAIKALVAAMNAEKKYQKIK